MIVTLYISLIYSNQFMNLPSLIRKKDESCPFQPKFIWALVMIASNPLPLFRICLVHEPPDNQSRNTRPNPIWYIAYTNDDIIQAVIVL